MLEVDSVVLHNGTASARARSRISGRSASDSTTSTRQPSRASRSATSPPGNHGDVGPTTSMRRSTSLVSPGVPRVWEPKTRTRPTPCCRAIRRMSSRLDCRRSAAAMCAPPLNWSASGCCTYIRKWPFEQLSCFDQDGGPESANRQSLGPRAETTRRRQSTTHAKDKVKIAGRRLWRKKRGEGAKSLRDPSAVASTGQAAGRRRRISDRVTSPRSAAWRPEGLCGVRDGARRQERQVARPHGTTSLRGLK
jgi:hypothetical protein